MQKQKWLNNILQQKTKKALPILSFPAVQLMDVTVREFIASSENQAIGMQKIAERTDAYASVSLMDLSVEAECFGSKIRVFENEVSTCIGRIIESPSDADALSIPPIGSARTGIYIDAIAKAKKRISDRPVFAGVIGPFSLAGRLVDVSEAMICCYDEPEMMHTILNKVTTFLIEYIQAYKSVGADGVIIAEPLAGLLSPALAHTFSEPYVRRIAQAAKDENFLVIYHNCGDGVIQMIDSILATECDAYHFGNSIRMSAMLQHIPQNIIAMGNVDPAGQFKNGTPQSIAQVTKNILEECSAYKNFIISSGCDIPPMAKWENIDAFFQAVQDFYQAES